MATKYATPAEMIDGEWLRKHNSEITGAMVQNCWRYYGIPPHIFLSIIGAETTFGHRRPDGTIDPKIGGELVAHFNYGCLRFGIHPKCDELAIGFVTVGGKDWYSFPSMGNGMMALGRYLKVGPLSDPGYYMRCFKKSYAWYRDFATTYYGNVPGLEAYIIRLEVIDAKLVKRANECGWTW